jgi:NAD(P)-dependent dehydrogenase (short-subunit alcohol dehydrogenase family)
MNILVTGGASGLGEAITRKLAQKASGCVYFTYNKSESSAQKIMRDYPNAKGVKCDFGNAEEVERLIEKFIQYDLDILINNAYIGSFIDAYFHKTSSDCFLKAFENNIIPTMKITQACISVFRKKKQGKIITVLTAALCNLPPVGSAVYVANKAYLEKLTKVWAAENAKYNISSNSVSPSFMQTALTSGIDERIVEQMINEHPLKKLLTVEEVADTVEFLTRASSHLNGVDIVMNAACNIK